MFYADIHSTQNVNPTDFAILLLHFNKHQYLVNYLNISSMDCSVSALNIP